MAEQQNRIPVKAMLSPELVEKLRAWAAREHRSMSSAAEMLIDIGLEAERASGREVE
jgi:hypothetical protein